MSCTTNIAQKFSQVQDKSHHRDVYQSQPRQPGFRSQPHLDSNKEFGQFATPAGVDWQFEPQNALESSHKVQQSGPTQAAQAGVPRWGVARPEAWVQQFQSMSMETAQTQYQLQNPMLSPLSHQTHNQPFASFAPRFSYAEAPSMAVQHTSVRAAPIIPEQQQRDKQQQDCEFDQAFSAAETRMNALTSHMNPLASGDKVDLQDVAKGVLHTVENSTTSDKMAEKMKNSGFMKLMLQLSNKEAVVKDNEIVNGDSTSSPAVEWQGPKLHQVEIKQPLYQEKLRDPVGGQQPKEAVEDYLHRIGTPEGLNSPSKLDEPESMPSAFEAANAFGPETVPISNWEEDYSGWVGQ